MRYLIISDIHANWQALEAVLANSAGQFDQILCCGDLVGYGGDPNRVVDWMRTQTAIVIRGNHDRACAVGDDLETFSPAARTSALWTRKALTAANREWLRTLAQGPMTVAGFQLIHGSPSDEDEYMIMADDFRFAFRRLMVRIAFFGHTHIQGAVSQFGGRVRSYPSGATLDTSGDPAWLINPGAVGQPRDLDSRAAYALFDSKSGKVDLRRVPYDVDGAQRAILAAGLPSRLAERLSIGT